MTMTKETKKKVMIIGGISLATIGGIYVYKHITNEIMEREAETDNESDKTLEDKDTASIDEIIQYVSDIPDDDEEGEDDEENNSGNQSGTINEAKETESGEDETEDEDDAINYAEIYGEDTGEQLWNCEWSESDDDVESAFYPLKFEKACAEIVSTVTAYEKVVELSGDENSEDIGHIQHVLYGYTNLLLAAYITWRAEEVKNMFDKFKIVYRIYILTLCERGVLEIEKALKEQIMEEYDFDPEMCRESLAEAAQIVEDLANYFYDANCNDIITFDETVELYGGDLKNTENE